jgi:hypothetical protein
MAPCACLVEEFTLITFKSTGRKYHGSIIFMQGTKFILLTIRMLAICRMAGRRIREAGWRIQKRDFNL